MTNSCNLTSRERQVLELIIAGFTNKAIAGQLGISEKTVEFHLEHVYTKTGARTRVLAALWAIRQSIGEEPRVSPG